MGHPLSRPLISVCIPAYNAVATIERTIRSVHDQGFDDLEIIVSDNASTDGTAELVEGLGLPGLRLVRQPRNLGMVRNYEAVIAASRGDFVKLLCADDTVYPGALEREARALDSAPSAVVMVVARRDVVIPGRGRLPRSPRLRRASLIEKGSSLQRRIIVSGRNLIGEGQAALVRGDVMRASAARGLGDPYVVDLSLWFHVLDQGDVVHLRQVHGAFAVSRAAATWHMRDRQRTEVSEFLRANAELRRVSRRLAHLGVMRAALGGTLRRLVYRLAPGRPRSAS